MNSKEYVTALHDLNHALSVLEPCNIPGFAECEGLIYNVLNDLEQVASNFSKREEIVFNDYLDGLTVDEIGEKHGLTYQNVYVALRNSFSKLNHAVMNNEYNFDYRKMKHAD